MSVFFFKPRNLWVSQWLENGTRKRRYFKTEQEARAFEDERLAPTAETDRLTLGELTAVFFRSNPGYHPKTRQNIVYFLAGRDTKDKHHEGPGEFLRDKFADALTRQDLERMREALRARKNGNNSINKYQAYLRAILAWGADQELIPRNPWRDFKRLPVERHRITTSFDDVRRVYLAAPDWLQWGIKTAYALSLRPGTVELFGLLWNAFDWRRGVVFVRQGKSGHIKTVFPPDSYLKEAHERFTEDVRAGIPLVCHRAGRKILSYSRAWEKAVADAGLHHFPMYDIRHVSASEALANGADLASVSAQLGHSSVATTGSVYAHVTAGGQRRAAALMPSISAESDSNTPQNPLYTTSRGVQVDVTQHNKKK